MAEKNFQKIKEKEAEWRLKITCQILLWKQSMI